MLCMTKQLREQNERKPRCRAATRGTDLRFGSKALIGKSDLKRQRRGRKERQEEMGLEQSWRADKVERNRKGTF